MSKHGLSRRRFLTLAGSGLAVAAAIIEPVRRFWQVSRNAPVGERVGPRNIYVDHRATAPGDGTALRPFATLGQAVLFAEAGDCVIMAPGEYRMASPATVRENLSFRGNGEGHVSIAMSYP